MQFQSVLNSIKRGVISPVYIIYGEEPYLQEQLVAAFKAALLTPDLAAFNLEELDGEKCSPAQVAESANVLPVFAEKRLVFVKNPAFLQSGKKESSEGSSENERSLLNYLADPLLSTCLVFLVNGPVDKRRKLVKAAEKAGQLIELNPPKGAELTQWIREEAEQQGMTIEPKALEYIVLNASGNLRHLKNELEKLCLYSLPERVIKLETVQKLLTRSSEGNIFAMVDSLGQKKGEQALQELGNLLDEGEPPVRILFMIARQFRSLLQVKELEHKGFTEKQITADLGLHPFVTGKLLRQSRNFGFTELEKALALLLEGDVALKTGSSPRLTLEQLILKLVDVRQ